MEYCCHVKNNLKDDQIVTNGTGVACMTSGRTKNTHEVLITKSEGMRLLGRPRHRRNDFKIRVARMPTGVNSSGIRATCVFFFKNGNEPSVFIKTAGYFLTGMRTVTCSRKSLLQELVKKPILMVHIHLQDVYKSRKLI
jgi:hypothetical protein